jgi:hypothetical protein
LSPEALHQAIKGRLSGRKDQSPDFQSRGEGGRRPLLRNSTTGAGPKPRPTARLGRTWRIILAGALAAVATVATTLRVLLPQDRSPSAERSVGASSSATPVVTQDVPTALEAARAKCAPSSDRVRLGDDGYTMIISRAVAKERPGIDRKTLDCIFAELDVPDSVVSHVENTTGFSGLQKADFPGFSAVWGYNTSDGLNMTIKQNRS